MVSDSTMKNTCCLNLPCSLLDVKITSNSCQTPIKARSSYDRNQNNPPAEVLFLVWASFFLTHLSNPPSSVHRSGHAGNIHQLLLWSGFTYIKIKLWHLIKSANIKQLYWESGEGGVSTCRLSAGPVTLLHMVLVGSSYAGWGGELTTTSFITQCTRIFIQEAFNSIMKSLSATN